MGDIDLKNIGIVDIAVALNLIYDIIERVRERTGATITPETIGDYVDKRSARRAEVNAALGLDQE